MTKNINELIAEVEKLNDEDKELKRQLHEAKETIDAVKTGVIDAIVVPDKNELKVFTEKTADKIYRILIEKMHEGAVTINEDGIILFCNSYFANLVNLPLQKAIGSKFTNFIDDGSKENFASLLKQGRENAVKKEIFIQTNDGNKIPVLVSINTLSVDTISVLSIILTDLTIQNKNKEELKHKTEQLEQKNIELENTNKELAIQIEEKEKQAVELNITNTQLKESEERFRLIVQNVKDYAIFLLDANGYIKTWNIGAERIKGYSANEIIGKHISTFYIEEEILRNEPEKNLKIAKEKGRFESEGWRVRKDGSRFFADVIYTALYDDKNNFQGFSKITRDITERKKAESEIKKKTDEVAQINKELILQIEEKEKQAAELIIANKDLTSFTYVSSHDLQEPLRKIRSFITLLLAEEEKKLSDDGKKYLQRIYETAKRMQELLEDLLSYFHSKVAERNFEKADITIILDKVKKDFEEEIQRKKATIEYSHLCETNIIRFQFHQLFQNLISNSLKFIKPETAPHIIIKSEIVPVSKLNNEKLSLKTDYCHIIYTDNGIGFEPQYNERIFEVFQRLHSKEEYPGNGIGLAICRRIVENHNGIITATGELNKGARFDIYIPVV